MGFWRPREGEATPGSESARVARMESFQRPDLPHLRPHGGGIELCVAADAKSSVAFTRSSCAAIGASASQVEQLRSGIHAGAIRITRTRSGAALKPTVISHDQSRIARVVELDHDLKRTSILRRRSRSRLRSGAVRRLVDRHGACLLIAACGGGGGGGGASVGPITTAAAGTDGTRLGQRQLGPTGMEMMNNRHCCAYAVGWTAVRPCRWQPTPRRRRASTFRTSFRRDSRRVRRT